MAVASLVQQAEREVSYIACWLSVSFILLSSKQRHAWPWSPRPVFITFISGKQQSGFSLSFRGIVERMARWSWRSTPTVRALMSSSLYDVNAISLFGDKAVSLGKKALYLSLPPKCLLLFFFVYLNS